jgi:hypothetical protein
LPAPRNDPKLPVVQFCRMLEELRRTDAFRVRSSKELVDTFFPHDEKTATDKLFRELPPDVRGPIVSAWGIRGSKAALRDDDERIARVVHDALVAGDIDADAFEEGISPEVLISYVPLAEWWAFWRGGRVAGAPIQRALGVARALRLFDDRWFLTHVEGRGGRLRGTDTLCDALSKDQIVGWIRNIHQSGDGSPAGLVAALGWDTVLAKTSQEALTFALDALAKELALVPVSPVAQSVPAADATEKDEPGRREKANESVAAPPPRPPPTRESARAIPARPSMAEAELPPRAGPDDMGWAGSPDEELDEHARPTMVAEAASVHDRPTSVMPPPPPPGPPKPPAPPRR